MPIILPLLSVLRVPDRALALVERRQSKPSVDAESSVGDDSDDDGECEGSK